MQKRVHLERVKAKPWAVDAAFTGERGLFDFAGNCEQPFEIYARGLPSPTLVKLGLESEVPVIGSLLGRCRKCGPCLEHRSRLWAARGCTEVLLSDRTWFGTLTLAPEWQFKALVSARSAARQRAVDWDELDEEEQFKRVDRQIAVELKRWLDRVRKRVGPIRYLVVCERHKSGLPHYHCLLHEKGVTAPHRVLTETWRWGFTKFKLVPSHEPEAVFYVTKYLSKDTTTRVRASFRYGTGGRQAQPVTPGENDGQEQDATTTTIPDDDASRRNETVIVDDSHD